MKLNDLEVSRVDWEHTVTDPNSTALLFWKSCDIWEQQNRYKYPNKGDSIRWYKKMHDVQ